MPAAAVEELSAMAAAAKADTASVAEAAGRTAETATAQKEAGFDFAVVGTVTEEPVFQYAGVQITMEEALEAWTGKLDKVFPYTAGKDKSGVASDLYEAKDIYVCKHKVARPTVFIPGISGHQL